MTQAKMLSHDKADKRKAPPPRLAGCGMSGWSHHEKVQALVLRRVAVIQLHRPRPGLDCLLLKEAGQQAQTLLLVIP